MVDKNAVKRFLNDVWLAAEQNGWPVNAMEIGVQLFGGGEELARHCTQEVLGECTTRGYFTTKPTFEFDIHGLSETAKTLIGVQG